MGDHRSGVAGCAHLLHAHGSDIGTAMADTPKYPEIEVQLTGEDGNGFLIIGRVRSAMRRAGLSDEEIETFASEATNDDYDHLLQTCMAWVTVN